MFCGWSWSFSALVRMKPPSAAASTSGAGGAKGGRMKGTSAMRSIPWLSKNALSAPATAAGARIGARWPRSGKVIAWVVGRAAWNTLKTAALKGVDWPPRRSRAGVVNWATASAPGPWPGNVRVSQAKQGLGGQLPLGVGGRSRQAVLFSGDEPFNAIGEGAARDRLSQVIDNFSVQANAA